MMGWPWRLLVYSARCTFQLELNSNPRWLSFSCVLASSFIIHLLALHHP